MPLSALPTGPQPCRTDGCSRADRVPPVKQDGSNEANISMEQPPGPRGAIRGCSHACLNRKSDSQHSEESRAHHLLHYLVALNPRGTPYGAPGRVQLAAFPRGCAANPLISPISFWGQPTYMLSAARATDSPQIPVTSL